MSKPNFSKSSGGITSIGTSYDLNKKTDILLSYSGTKYFNTTLRLIHIRISSISSATVLSVKMTSDSSGDKIFLSDTSGSIDVGLTTPTKGVVQLDISSMLYDEGETFYIFAKVDTGSVNIDEVIITYSGNGG